MAVLEGALENALRHIPDAALSEMLSFSVFPAGKRIRPHLFLELVNVFGGELSEDCYHIACAIELIHCASLIHDDLPSIDNDLMRRGKPAFHVQYGIANAVLGGDLLYAIALGEVGKLRDSQRSAEVLKVVNEAHIDIQVGQLLDIQNGQDIETLRRVHDLKTGTLFKACALSAYAFRQPECSATREEAEAFGIAFGRLFQLKNDLDDTHQVEELARAAGSDLASGRGSLERFSLQDQQALQATARVELLNSLERLVSHPVPCPSGAYQSEGALRALVAEYL
jgi:geranylgeranyl pyrophosphate synthase